VPWASMDQISGSSLYLRPEACSLPLVERDGGPSAAARLLTDGARVEVSGPQMDVAQTDVAILERDASAALSMGAARANGSAIKRLIDLTGSMVGLAILFPLLCLIALRIRFESPGPALFRQRRVGRDGAVFYIYKFRSMRVVEDDASITQAVPADRRVTKFGAFLRRSCIDELPQLLNVIKGEMSLVGPRPHVIVQDAYYTEALPSYASRLLVRPGIAGLAQVCGSRGVTPTLASMADRVRMDQAYIKHWSLALDVQILIRAVTDGPFHPAAF
jgi:lipopolysaccharide/colanic/teichoic acid biosynthesis glycosyltransferase